MIAVMTTELNNNSNNNHKKEVQDMSGIKKICLRLSIVLMMVAVVLAILYFTPMPDQRFKSCERPCHPLDWPMICRVTLKIETYKTMSGICKDCSLNSTDCTICLTGDGSTRGVMTANHQIPAPPIHVCQNDIMVIDVVNKMPSHNLAIHWRGQPQNEAPFMDGVPMITQCPITSYTTFQYRFRVSAPGTHFYHAHSDADRTDGLFGALIVRQPDSIDPQKEWYDNDLKEHLLMVSEWSSDLTSNLKAGDKPRAILVNGRGGEGSKNTPYIFKVEKGQAYRFRLIYSSGILGCQIRVSIQNHELKIISLDGNPITPFDSSSITLNKGETVDFVIKADQNNEEYEIKAESTCDQNIVGYASLLYNDTTVKLTPKNDNNNLVDFNTSPCVSSDKNVCLNDVQNLYEVPIELRGNVFRKIYLNFDYESVNETVENHSTLKPKQYRVNNITFTYPSSPILTQPSDVSDDNICNELKIPKKCENQKLCECFHVEYIPLDTSVELVLINSAPEEKNAIFHLHGYSFYFVGHRTFERKFTIEEIKGLDADNKLFKYNLENSPLKDTIRVPANSVVTLRFMANNPGFWILRDEQSNGWTRGMDIVFQVGSKHDVTNTPSGFPTCGSFVGPEFFLI